MNELEIIWSNLRYCVSSYLVRLRRNMKNLTQVGWFKDRDLDWGRLKYEEALTALFTSLLKYPVRKKLIIDCKEI